MRFIGDVHGNMQRYLGLIHGAEESVQVGDFGIGFIHNPIEIYPHERHRFIRGNHDWPLGCTHEPNWIKDGTVEDDVMYIGGAYSIDKGYRTEGRDWWPDEELSYDQLNVMIDKYIMAKPRVMVTHEVPQELTKLFTRPIWEVPERTRRAFDVMLEYHKPKLWIAGHWHFPFDYEYKGCRFIILDCDNYIDIDLKGDLRENIQQSLAL
jgi:hypothetical protein